MLAVLLIFLMLLILVLRLFDTTKVVEINVPLKYLGNFWRTFEMSLINCEIKVLKEHVTGINSNQKQQYRDTTTFTLPN